MKEKFRNAFIILMILYVVIESFSILIGKSLSTVKGLVGIITVNCFTALLFARVVEGKKYSRLGSIGIKAVVILTILQLIESIGILAILLTLAKITLILNIAVSALAIVLDIASFETTDPLYEKFKKTSTILVLILAVLIIICLLSPSLMVSLLLLSLRASIFIKFVVIMGVAAGASVLCSYVLMIDISRDTMNLEGTKSNNLSMSGNTNIGFGLQNVNNYNSNNLNHNISSDILSNNENTESISNIPEQKKDIAPQEPAAPDIDLSSYGPVGGTNSSQEPKEEAKPQEPAVPDIDLSSYGTIQNNNNNNNTESSDNSEEKVNPDDLW